MAPHRKRTALAQRRQADEEGDDMSVATEVADDSQSDASLPSDVDEDADADNSDLSETDSPQSLRERKRDEKINGSPGVNRSLPQTGAARRVPSPPPIARSDAAFTTSKNTELMRSGVKPAEKDSSDDAVDFDTGRAAVEAPAAGTRPETLAERRRREHEDYQKRRAEDPTFTPTRGPFYQHDVRSAPGNPGYRPFNRGGSGRGGRGGGNMAASYRSAK